MSRNYLKAGWIKRIDLQAVSLLSSSSCMLISFSVICFTYLHVMFMFNRLKNVLKAGCIIFIYFRGFLIKKTYLQGFLCPMTNKSLLYIIMPWLAMNYICLRRCSIFWFFNYKSKLQKASLNSKDQREKKGSLAFARQKLYPKINQIYRNVFDLGCELWHNFIH